MTLSKEAKQEIIGKHGQGEADTGSAQVQIALLTARINELTEHLRTHANYLQRKDLEGYRALIKELGLRR
jgi:small subunit ribosomal protein S15